MGNMNKLHLCTVLVLLSLPGTSALAAAASPVDNAACSSATPSLAGPVWGAWYDKVLAPFEGALNTKKRMVQFATVGMIIALWIIWWRK